MRIEMQLRQTTENQIKINFTNNKTSTKCTKMTEESDTIRNGMNVSVNGGGATQNGASGCNSKTSTGGRLQFFKGEFTFLSSTFLSLFFIYSSVCFFLCCVWRLIQSGENEILLSSLPSFSSNVRGNL